MTIQEFHSRFDIVQDVYGAPYFLEEEKDALLNMAQDSIISDLELHNFYPLGSKFSDIKTEDATYEGRINYDKAMQGLFKRNIPITSQGGMVLVSELETITDSSFKNIKTIFVSNENSGDLMNGIEVEFESIMNQGRRARNSFKRPTVTFPRYITEPTGYMILPYSGEENDFFVTFIRNQIKMSFDDDITSELHSDLHDEVLILALEYAGISTRDMELYQAVKASKQAG